MMRRLCPTITVARGYSRKAVGRTFVKVAVGALRIEPHDIRVRVRLHRRSVTYPDPFLSCPSYSEDFPISLFDLSKFFFDELSVLLGDLTPEQSSYYKFRCGRFWTGCYEVGLRVSSIDGVRYAVKVDQDLLALMKTGDDSVLPYQLYRESEEIDDWDKLGQPQAVFEACCDLAFGDAAQSNTPE